VILFNRLAKVIEHIELR